MNVRFVLAFHDTLAWAAGVQRGGRGGETSERGKETSVHVTIGEGDACKDAMVFIIPPLD